MKRIGWIAMLLCMAALVAGCAQQETEQPAAPASDQPQAEPADTEQPAEAAAGELPGEAADSETSEPPPDEPLLDDPFGGSPPLDAPVQAKAEGGSVLGAIGAALGTAVLEQMGPKQQEEEPGEAPVFRP